MACDLAGHEAGLGLRYAAPALQVMSFMKALFPPAGITPVDPNRTVGDLAQSLRGAARTFEKLGIDFCCHGNQSLREVVAESALSLDSVVAQLEAASAQGALGWLAPAPDASHPALLVAHIVSRHHVFTRGELARLGPLATKVLRAHNATHPELVRVRELLKAISHDLLPHMTKEEQVLFPYISRLGAGDDSLPPFGRIENPLRIMQLEHEQVGDLLRALETVTLGYRPPVDACASYRALYAGLKALQEDLHQHIHLENNVLFPAARALEERVTRPA